MGHKNPYNLWKGNKLLTITVNGKYSLPCSYLHIPYWFTYHSERPEIICRPWKEEREFNGEWIIGIPNSPLFSISDVTRNHKDLERWKIKYHSIENSILFTHFSSQVNILQNVPKQDKITSEWWETNNNVKGQLTGLLYRIPK